MSRLAFLVSNKFSERGFPGGTCGGPASGPGKTLYAYITVVHVMTIITIRIDDETRRMMRGS
jgi:hypothetical protein